VMRRRRDRTNNNADAREAESLEFHGRVSRFMIFGGRRLGRDPPL
jgi:hypothetical protein